jgi:pimeloyl-ACP methyl ester carboxylesterase/DNA-binding SARP family transcriptional activator
MLMLRVLGRMELARDDSAVPLPQSKKTRALLAYLAMTGRAHSRDKLCEMFWDLPDDPRGSLRWSLSKLRLLVNEDGTERLQADRETVALDCAGMRVDLLAVRDAIGEDFEEAPLEVLIGGLDAFRGPFLEGIELERCSGFRSWLVAEREQARILHARSLFQLANRLAEKQPEEALRYMRRLIEVEPDCEEARTSFVRLLARNGLINEAEQQYEIARRHIEALSGTPAAMLTHAWRELRGLPPSIIDLQAERPSPSSVTAPRRAAAAVGIELAERREPAAGADRVTPAPLRDIEQEIRFCTAKDGVRIAYATAGKGPPLVKSANWLNHLEFDWQSPVWRHLLHALARHHQLVRYDERGNGLSDWSAENLSLDWFVQDLETVVDAAGLDRFPLFGISQGCAVSIAYAVRHPERVTRLILAGGYARGWRKRGSPDEIARREALLTLTLQGWGQENPAYRQIFTSLYLPDATPEQANWWNELQRITTSPQNAHRLAEAFSKIDVRDLLDKVKVPTVVLHSRRDAVVPFDSGRELASGIRGARFVPLDSRNHLILEHEQAWPRFLAEISAFLPACPDP